MPRVSQAHLDARRQQILDAARRCFVVDGFHATSTRDILRVADLSAGAFYRYFDSKDAIVAAIASECLDQLTNGFDAALGSGTERPLDQALDEVFDVVDRLHRTQDLSKLIVTVWAESVRIPELARLFNEAFGRVRLLTQRAIEQQRDRGLLSPDTSSDGLARVLVGALQGYVIQNALLDEPRAREYRESVHRLIS
ncbi:TetR/AcrR family transcriptional regulator [Streptomyces sp. URMC 129]|uniref:TetR/AcrR family transcriptional regulator n=1 Tax=Streptomyces sp. URMC 129 TaxID=3423407 RepID=UPI003F1B699E